jgi:DNA-binding IclR family transcriptional regulator
MSEEPKKLVPALIKAEKVLDYIAANKKVSFTDIYKNVGIAKSSAYSLLATLEHFQFIRQTPSGEYCLGLKLFSLGSLAVTDFDLRTEAKPFVADLAQKVQLTTHLGILQGTEGFYLIKEEIEHILKITSWEGKRIRLLSSGLGKILLAWLPEDVLDQILRPGEMIARTATTITSPEAMKKELTLIRERGWAFDNEEDGYGVRCVAAAVRGFKGEVIGSVSVCGTLHQIPTKRIGTLAENVKNCCESISQKMGCGL